MPKQKRHKTRYPGVYYIEGKSQIDGKQEKTYYIHFRRKGTLIEEKAGRQYQDAMTPSKASHIRTLKISGKIKSNVEHRSLRNEKVTLNYLFKIFSEHKAHLKSHRDDLSRYNNHIRVLFGDLEVHEIKPVMLYKLRDKLLKNHKPATVKQILGVIQRIVNFCHSIQLCPRFDFNIDMPKFDNKITEDLTEEQRKRLQNILNEYELYHRDSVNIMRLALYTGLRRGMIYGLKWTDIDFEHGFINIRQEEAKSKVSERIPLNSLAQSVLESVEQRDSDYIFPNRTGGRLNKDAYNKHFRRIRDLAKLPKNFRPIYGLRHTFASNLASSGKVDLYTLQKLMTHKSADMTQRYAHLRDETLKKASEVTTDFYDQPQESSNDK